MNSPTCANLCQTYANYPAHVGKGANLCQINVCQYKYIGTWHRLAKEGFHEGHQGQPVPNVRQPTCGVPPPLRYGGGGDPNTTASVGAREGRGCDQ